jgi:acylphosphatase
LRIHGRVQGVWYRGWTVEQATRLGLRGWVRNREDGSVEAVMSGEPHAVADMIEACWQGPPAARVMHIDVKEASAFEGEGFSQRPTVRR